LIRGDVGLKPSDTASALLLCMVDLPATRDVIEPFGHRDQKHFKPGAREERENRQNAVECSRAHASR
jgi:hypothetical protein